MKKYFTLLFCFAVAFCSAQTNICDFETAATSTSFTHFGGTLEGVVTSAITNPDPTGDNTSAMVIQISKADDAPTWGGAFSSTPPAGGIDATNGGEVCVDVWMDHMGTVSLKLEASSDSDPINYLQTLSNTVVNGWETLCFDLDLNSLEGDMIPATGNMYNNIVMFVDFGVAGTGTQIDAYFDNFTIPEGGGGGDVACTTILDWETLSGDFQYFGSSLDMTLTSTIANPNPSGINTSANVMQYVKAGDAMTWAGSFLVGGLANPIDGTLTSEVCMKVHSDHPGNVTLKLELADNTDPDNWINTQAVVGNNQWEEICFNLAEASFEGNMGTAAGFVYPNLVIFPDFGVAGDGTDINFYFDDFVVKTSNVINDYDVTFSVDMNQYTGSFTQVYVSGTFNGWNGVSNPLEDADNDGIWEGVVNMPQGAHEYKFTLDDWTVQEEFGGLDECTVSTDDGNGNIFTNRAMNVLGDMMQGTYCWNSCYACGEAYSITWNVSDALIDVISPEGLFVAGGVAFGHGDFPLKDDDGDGVWSLTIERGLGFTSDYTFINGTCLPDWACKENIAGQACAVEPFNDRNLPEVMGDVVINTCFGECTTDLMCGVVDLYNVTFNVDMSMETVTDGVWIFGNTINNWTAMTTEMLDPESDGTYTVTVQLPEGAHEYKFLNGAEAEILDSSEPCTITDMTGQFTNRLLLLAPADTTINLVSFASCDLMVNNENIVVDNNLVNIYPTITNHSFTIDFNEVTPNQEISIVDIAGKVIFETEFNNVDTKQIEVADFPKGLHFVKIKVGQKTTTKKLLVQ